MKELTQEITEKYKQLSAEDQDMIKTVMSNHFGKPCGLSAEALASFDLSELELIHSTLNGIILTRNFAPELGKKHAANADKLDFPQKISFGRIKKSKN